LFYTNETKIYGFFYGNGIRIHDLQLYKWNQDTGLYSKPFEPRYRALLYKNGTKIQDPFLKKIRG
jgi:hypothetical protein